MHRDPRARAGPVCGQPARAELERGAHLAQRIEQGQGIAQRVGPGQARRSSRARWRGWRPGRAPHCAARAARASAQAGRAGSCGDGLALQPLDHQPGRADASSSSPRRRRAGTGTPAVAAASSRARSVRTCARGGPPPRSIWRMSGRRPPSDSRSKALVIAGGATREPAQVAHLPPRRGAERGGQPSAAWGTSLDRCALLDGDDRPPGLVELVQVLADAETGARRRRRGRRRSNGPVPR